MKGYRYSWAKNNLKQTVEEVEMDRYCSNHKIIQRKSFSWLEREMTLQEN